MLNRKALGPVSFAPDLGIPEGEVGCLKGSTGGQAQVPDRSGSGDRAL